MSNLSQKLSDKHPLYFEAILQLRDAPKEVHAVVEHEIHTAGTKVVKRVSYRNGTDLYLPDKNFAIRLGKKLQHRFGGIYLVTCSLHTKKKGVDIYRFTVLYRGIAFKKGDLIRYKGEAHEVKVLGKDILLQRQSDHKKVHMKWKDAPDCKKVERS